jgi:hypothetical protein
MCWLCEEQRGAACELCGCLVCFEVTVGDDVVRPARITDDGEIVCRDCAQELDDDVNEDEELYIRLLLEGF